ncbi:MAG TPA: YciI family protein [Marinagarivorans sp.]
MATYTQEKAVFFINITYKVDLIEVDRHIEAHIAYLNKHYDNGSFVLSGRKKPRTGGVILATTDDRARLDAIVSEDPFYRHQLADYTIIEFEPSKAAKGLKGLITAL